MSSFVRPLPREQRYVLLERLGRGGAAETWRAQRQGGLIDDEVCLKRPLFRLDEGQRRALIEEARLLARVRHANVVSLIDALEDECGGVFLVLELVRGSDLRFVNRSHALHDRRFPAGVVAHIGLALCRALGAAQRAVPGGIVHRDVTPHNVLVSYEGQIKLADFGIARASDRERWTCSGHVKGKSAYLSPEQIRDAKLDARSDLFSVGVVLYELIAGQRPFGDGSSIATLRAIENNERAPLVRAAPAVPEELAAVVEQLLEPERDRRPQSPDDAARLLSPLADEQLAIDELSRSVWALRGPGPTAVRPVQHGPFRAVDPHAIG